MSEVTAEARTARRNPRHEAETGTTTHTSAPHAAAPADLGTVTLTIAELPVTVPVKFAPGHVLTDTQAKILDAAFQRQFINNQAANIKARAERFAKATTDAERAANAPQNAEAIAAIYADYEPAVGGATRQSMVEKLRMEAGKRALIAMILEHNKAAETGGAPVILRAVDADGKARVLPVPRAPAKTKAQSADEHKAAVDAFHATMETNIQRILSAPEYAERVQVQLDALEAERGAAKSKPDATVAITADLF